MPATALDTSLFVVPKHSYRKEDQSNLWKHKTSSTGTLKRQNGYEPEWDDAPEFTTLATLNPEIQDCDDCELWNGALKHPLQSILNVVSDRLYRSARSPWQEDKGSQMGAWFITMVTKAGSGKPCFSQHFEVILPVPKFYLGCLHYLNIRIRLLLYCLGNYPGFDVGDMCLKLLPPGWKAGDNNPKEEDLPIRVELVVQLLFYLLLVREQFSEELWVATKGKKVNEHWESDVLHAYMCRDIMSVSVHHEADRVQFVKDVESKTLWTDVKALLGSKLGLSPALLTVTDHY